MILAVNLIGARNTCLAAQPHPTAADGASVILISSTRGLAAGSNISVYGVSKHGVLYLASDESRYVTGAVLPVDAGMVVI